jgi:hypothetical protein
MPVTRTSDALDRRRRALCQVVRVQRGVRRRGAIRQGQAQLGRRRGLERIKPHEGQPHVEDHAGFPIRQTLDGPAVDQVHHQPDGNVGEGGEIGDAETAHLHLALDGLWRPREEQPVGPGELGLVVGDQARALFDQPQRQVRFAGPRGPAQQHGDGPRLRPFGGRRTHARDARRESHTACMDQLTPHGFSLGGVDRRTTKRAPLILRVAGSIRFSA